MIKKKLKIMEQSRKRLWLTARWRKKETRRQRSMIRTMQAGEAAEEVYVLQGFVVS